MSSFTQKGLKLKIELANDKSFSDASEFSFNTLETSELRILADVKNIGQFCDGVSATVRIFGLRQTMMNDLSILTYGFGRFARNKITIIATDGAIETQVFKGTIIQAWGDYPSMPEVPLTLQAAPAYVDRLEAAKPNSYQGEADVATIMKDIAAQMGYELVNHGVNKKCSSPYLAGSLMNQLQSIAKSLDVFMFIDGDNLHISDQDKPFSSDGESVPLINIQTGLVAAPAWNQIGIQFKSLFNPAIQFNKNIIMDSTVIPANGEWLVRGLNARLDSQKKNGDWFSEVVCQKFGAIAK